MSDEKEVSLPKPQQVRLSDLTPRARARLKEELRPEVRAEEREGLEEHFAYWRKRAAEADKIEASHRGVIESGRASGSSWPACTRINVRLCMP